MQLIVIIVVGIVALAIVFVIMSFVLIKENERAVLISLGVVQKMLEPGLRFCPWIISRLKRYSMEPMIFKIKVSTAITKNGLVKGYKEDGKEIEKVEVDINLILTSYFSDSENRLCETARRAPGCNSKGIGPIIVPFVTDVVRSAFAEMPWVLSYQERKKMLDYITARIIPNYPYFELLNNLPAGKKVIEYNFSNTKNLASETETEMMRYNPLVQFQLDMCRTSIAIVDINFCNKDLANSLTLAEKARLTADADAIKLELESKGIKDKGLAQAAVDKVNKLNETDVERVKGFDKADIDRLRGLDLAEVTKVQGAADAKAILEKGNAEAKARQEMIKIIKDHPDLEALRSLVEMAQGTSNTILYGLPAALEDKLVKALGGNKPTDLVAMLKDPEVLKAIKKQLGN